jgi:glycolate oxidase FAD binding subunit
VIASVSGVAVPSVASPGSLEELSSVMAASAADGSAVCFAGGGTKLDVGAAPTRLDRLVSTAAMAGVIEYNPADLIVRAQAGLPLATLQAIVAEKGQRLALDPPEIGATLGGVVAANASGPLRHRYGTVRDLLIGATFVLADGTVSHTGGKVVKNVAGYDLGKLLTGSYGTLAVLADVTFRLHSLPAASVAVQTPVASVDDVERVLAAYGSSFLEPSALELACALPAAAGTITALFEGEPAAAQSHATAAVDRVGDSRIVDWTDAAHPWGGDTLGLRVAFPPAALGSVLRAWKFGPAEITARAGVGVLELTSAADPSTVAGLRAAVAPLGATVVVVSAPPAVKAELDVWGPVAGLSLMRSIKDQFDPAHRLAPGRFVGGI